MPQIERVETWPAISSWTWLLFCCFSCGPSASDPQKTVIPSQTPVWFQEVAAASGLNFSHENDAKGTFYLPEIMGSGCAYIDFDRDGDLDVYLVQGGSIDGPPQSSHDRLFRNDSPAGASPDQLRFVDVTQASGIRATGYGMGVAVADVDRDGWPDLYVTNLGENQLWRNQGDGSFTDLTQAAGAGDSRWSISASFCDIDADGWPDLFIGNYTAFSKSDHKPCYGPMLDYCHPRTYPPAGNRLLRNRGDGTFIDVSETSGISEFKGRTLGVLVADFNRDMLPDIYVANDAQANFLWLNQGQNKFRESGLFSGAALNLTGQPEGSMGLDAADFDEDGDEDLFIAHLRKETNTLYCNDGNGFFEDCSNPTGLGQPSLPFTGFGAGWLDVDRDGFLDIFVCNGSVAKLEELTEKNDPQPYHQTNQLFRQSAPGRFEEITTYLGEAALHSEVSRGTAFGDIDNDGDIDILIQNNQGPVRLLVNRAETENHWLGLELGPETSNRFLDHTKVTIHLQDGTVRHRRFRRDGSYLSSNDPRLVIGLGNQKTLVRLEILWPDGKKSNIEGLEANRYHQLTYTQGQSQQPEPSP